LTRGEWRKSQNFFKILSTWRPREEAERKGELEAEEAEVEGEEEGALTRSHGRNVSAS
jgi:hypothetical protein